MKAELMKRWREREFPAPFDWLADKPVDSTPADLARWIIDIVADALDIRAAATNDLLLERLDEVRCAPPCTGCRHFGGGGQHCDGKPGVRTVFSMVSNPHEHRPSWCPGADYQPNEQDVYERDTADEQAVRDAEAEARATLRPGV